MAEVDLVQNDKTVEEIKTPKSKWSKSTVMNFKRYTLIIVVIVAVSFGVFLELHLYSNLKKWYYNKYDAQYGGGTDAPATDEKKFVAMEGKEFKEMIYFGYMDEIISQVKFFASVIYRIMNDKENLQKQMTAESMGTFLLGPPGTGKTLYVKKFCYELECELKKIRKFKENGFDMSKYVLGQVTDEEKRLCDNADGVVRLYVIKPSDIKDKWVGNSEKNVKRLFGHLRSDLKPHHVNIAFFDEGEALFGSRKNMRKEDTTGAGIMQEFLTQISAISEDFQASFIFAATNMKEMIDPAIFRRFSNKIYFKNPDSIIRKKYIEHFIKKYNASDADITRLTQVTHNRSFSFIESLLTKFKNYDADGNFLKFNTAGAEQYIRGVEDMEKEEFRR